MAKSLAQPLYIDDFVLVQQSCNSSYMEFDDLGIANFMEDMADLGYSPAQYARIWIHTHPEMAATPSQTDETTFAEKFSDSDWAVMAIISKTNDTYARYKVNSHISMCERIPWVVDWESAPELLRKTDMTALIKQWDDELFSKVQEKVWVRPKQEVPQYKQGDLQEYLTRMDKEYGTPSRNAKQHEFTDEERRNYRDSWEEEVNENWQQSPADFCSDPAEKQLLEEIDFFAASEGWVWDSPTGYYALEDGHPTEAERIEDWQLLLEAFVDDYQAELSELPLGFIERGRYPVGRLEAEANDATVAEVAKAILSSVE